MLEPFASLLARGPVGAFGCYDVGDGRGRAARAPAGAGACHPHAGRDAARAGRGARSSRRCGPPAQAAPARVCLQADHVHDLETIELACRLGVAGGDGGLLAAAVRGQRRVRARGGGDRARATASRVEGELGRLPGGADADAPSRRGRSSPIPSRPPSSSPRTGVDCLAVALGNVHGALLPAPRALDWERLARVRRAVDVPLALHGGTGLAPRGGRRARSATGSPRSTSTPALRRAYLAATAAALPGAEPAADLVALHARQADAVEAVARATLAAIGLAEQLRPRW